MAARKRDKRVIIKQQSAGQDATGQPTATWTDVVPVWANILVLNGLETIKSDAPTSIVKASIRIGYRAGINAGMRVYYGSTAYDIKAVLPDVEKKKHVDLVCEAVSV